jgi:hypothetical protein
MAISSDYPGLSAEVIVDGQPLKEYEDNDTTVEREPHTVVRYVRVNSNARFGRHDSERFEVQAWGLDQPQSRRRRH